MPPAAIPKLGNFADSQIDRKMILGRDEAVAIPVLSFASLVRRFSGRPGGTRRRNRDGRFQSPGGCDVAHPKQFFFVHPARPGDKGTDAHNRQTPFGIGKIASGNSVRDRLDAADPAPSRPCFARLEKRLAKPPLRPAFARLIRQDPDRPRRNKIFSRAKARLPERFRRMGCGQRGTQGAWCCRTSLSKRDKSVFMQQAVTPTRAALPWPLEGRTETHAPSGLMRSDGD